MLSSLHPSPVEVHAAGNGSQGLCPESGWAGPFPPSALGMTTAERCALVLGALTKAHSDR